MKWAVTGLVFLGVAAACCAAFLVNSLRMTGVITVAAPTTQSTTTTIVQVELLTASRALPAMTVLDASAVQIKDIPKGEAPVGFISNPVEVIGRVLAVPLAAGDAFTPACFTGDATMGQVAGVIPAGKRAVGISVSDYSGLQGLLYPGSMVDVMVSFRPESGDSPDSARPAVTRTLLENVQVLAIESQTVVSSNQSLSQVLGDPTQHSSGAHRVTLLVDTRQAKALELAMQQATLSLALRNPMDSGHGDKESVWEDALMPDREARLREIQVAKQAATQPTLPPPPPHWDTVVVRGNSPAATESFPLPTAPN